MISEVEKSPIKSWVSPLNPIIVRIVCVPADELVGKETTGTPISQSDLPRVWFELNWVTAAAESAIWETSIKFRSKATAPVGLESSEPTV